jgi:hypothetical protein
MRFSFKPRWVLVAVLLTCGGSVLQCQAQTSFPPCRDDGFPPDGLDECECTKPPILYRGEYRSAGGRYQVHLPDGVVATAPSCGAVGKGFQIALAHRETGETDGELPWNRISVGWFERGNRGLQEMAERWTQNQGEDMQRDDSTDLQIDPPVQTSLSSLSAIRLKASRNSPSHGKLICEVLFAEDQDGNVYVVGMVSPAERHDKDKALFQDIVEGFRYIPPERSATR